MEDKIEKIKKISRKEGAAKIIEPQEELQRVGPNKDHFDNLMQLPKPEKVTIEQKLEPSRKTSLMDEVRELNSKSEKPTRVTPADLIAQTDQVLNQIDDVKTRLSTPDASLKESAVPILRNKLSHINEGIRIATSHLGGEFETNPQLPPVGPKENPINRFLGYLTDGQYKLENLATQIEALGDRHDLNPSVLLLMQVKINMVSQELSFFSNVLNQALQSIKTVMNVQV